MLTEAYPGGKERAFERQLFRSAPGQDGMVTAMAGQSVGTARYFNAAGKARLAKPLPPCATAK